MLLFPAADANRASSQENVTSLKINSAAQRRVLPLLLCWNASAKTESHRTEIQLPTHHKQRLHSGSYLLLNFSVGLFGSSWAFGVSLLLLLLPPPALLQGARCVALCLRRALQQRCLWLGLGHGSVLQQAEVSPAARAGTAWMHDVAPFLQKALTGKS